MEEELRSFNLEKNPETCNIWKSIQNKGFFFSLSLQKTEQEQKSEKKIQEVSTKALCFIIGIDSTWDGFPGIF